MDLPEYSSSSTDNPSTSLGQKFEPRNVVVAVDATRELKLAALQYALKNFVRPGDKLYLLGILHQVLNPVGFKQKADITQFTGTNHSVLQEEILKKKAEFEKGITDPQLQKLFDVKQVSAVVHIAAGPDRKVVTARQAVELRATWLILDKDLEKEKTYLLKQVNCNLVLMKPKNEAGVTRPELRDQQSLNSSGLLMNKLSYMDMLEDML